MGSNTTVKKLCASFYFSIYKEGTTFCQEGYFSQAINMSGVWEALFQEEKQDWITCVVSSVTTLLNLLVELPCTLLALLSSTLLLSWDYACQGAQQVSDLLALEEWWTLEHALWVAG